MPIVRDWTEGRTIVGLNPREDWADSVIAYVHPDYAPSHGKQISEGRWDYVARQMNPGNPEGFAYPEKFREVGYFDTLMVGDTGEVLETK